MKELRKGCTWQTLEARLQKKGKKKEDESTEGRATRMYVHMESDSKDCAVNISDIRIRVEERSTSRRSCCYVGLQ